MWIELLENGLETLTNLLTKESFKAIVEFQQNLMLKLAKARFDLITELEIENIKIPYSHIGYYSGFIVGFIIEEILIALATGGMGNIGQATNLAMQSFSQTLKGVGKFAKKGAQKLTTNLEEFIELLSQIRKESKNLKGLLKKLDEWVDEMLDNMIKGKKLRNLKLSDEAKALLKKYADNAVLAYTRKQRPAAVAVLEGNGKRVFAYSNKSGLTPDDLPNGLHPLVKEWLETAPKIIVERPTHGKCAEPAAISKWLWEMEGEVGRIKPVTLEEARKAFDGVVSQARSIKGERVPTLKHNTFKKACDTCNPLLEHFNITQIFN